MADGIARLTSALTSIFAKGTASHCQRHGGATTAYGTSGLNLVRKSIVTIGAERRERDYRFRVCGLTPASRNDADGHERRRYQIKSAVCKFR